MNMKDYFPGSHKPLASKTLLNEAVEIFQQAGIPIEQLTKRRLERMAMCFLAVAGIRDSWQQIQGLNENRRLKTRDIIVLLNEQFGENISSGSYDDIRRKDLKLLVLANIVINSAAKPDAATNDPTRGYAIDPLFADLVKTFKTEQWPAALKGYLQDRESLAEILSRQRNIFKVPIVLPSGEMFELSSGDHNLLQKKLIEEFLPRFGGGSQVLYIGDTSNKTLYIAREKLAELNFYELSHDEMPDIIAYHPLRNWLYLIEAVHSSGPMSETRLLELKRLTQKCTAKILFVTGFLTKSGFRKWITDIAWETEVWIAESPDHLIHFDGEKYLTPYE